MPIKTWIFLAAGGALGTIVRIWIMQRISQQIPTGFPWGTLVVNSVGCFIMGMFWVLLIRWHVPESFRLFLTAGFLGGFTTFSTFGLDAYLLITNQNFLYAMSYIVSSVVLGLICVKVGALAFS